MYRSDNIWRWYFASPNSAWLCICRLKYIWTKHSQAKPIPPWNWTALLEEKIAISLAWAFAILALASAEEGWCPVPNRSSIAVVKNGEQHRVTKKYALHSMPHGYVSLLHATTYCHYCSHSQKSMHLRGSKQHFCFLLIESDDLWGTKDERS